MGSKAEELMGPVHLGDARLERRLLGVVGALMERPEATIPAACGSWSDAIGAYRLLRNDAVTPEAITEGVADATAARCPVGATILAVQDTTSVDYTNHRGAADLGPLEHPEHRGVFLHTTLAVTADGEPLGVLDQQSWVRDPETVGSRHQRPTVPVEGKESAKWLRAVRSSVRHIGSRCQVVTIADREADLFDVFAVAAELTTDWVIRARHDRVLPTEAGRLGAKLAQAPLALRTEVEVARQANHTPRTATVEIRATELVLDPPRDRHQKAKAAWRNAHPAVPATGPTRPEPLVVGVILVTEPAPPEGVTPLRWMLLTSLPITTPDEILTCVNFYRLRWLVERFHFVLKSGCQVERLQLEQAARVRRALAIYSAVAAWLLHTTYLARVQPDAPATLVLDDDAWQALLTVHHPQRPLPPTPPTVREAIRLIAMLGGFLARTGDGEPGVKTVWRGFRRLSDIVLSWRIFRNSAAGAS